MAFDATLVPTKLYDCTKSDTVANAGSGFRVYTTAGDVNLQFIDGTTAICKSVQVGETVRVSFAKVMSASTTAVGITVFAST